MFYNRYHSLQRKLHVVSMDEWKHCILTVSVLVKNGHCINKIRCLSDCHYMSMLQPTDRACKQEDKEFVEGDQSTETYYNQRHALNLDTRTREVKLCKIRMSCHMDPLLASCITIELQRSECFRKAFMVLLQRHCRKKHCKEDLLAESPDSERKHMHFKVFLLVSNVHFFRMDPDIQWSDRMLPWWTARLILEDAFSWLSTLGGAYSSLGENFSHCAIEAGRLSVRQLKLAIRLGDPLLQARCYVYMALSLMQRGFLKQARDIIRQQYKFAISFGEHSDTRLIAMCRGVWSHLRFHYQRRRQMQEARQQQSKASRRTQQNGTKSIDISHAVVENIVI